MMRKYYGWARKRVRQKLGLIPVPRHLHSVRNYEKLVKRHIAEFPQDRAWALARSIGAADWGNFRSQGDGHVAVLRHHGLADGMAIYDLGCGCGRTAQALVRSGWQGAYTGADIVQDLADEIPRTCPGYTAFMHRELTIAAPDASQDMIFHWSVFTHLYPEECFLYLEDSFRALKPGGATVFSFLEHEDPEHRRLFDDQVSCFRRRSEPEHLDAFLHRDWIRNFARRIGYAEPAFTDGADATHHPAFWQSLAVLRKPQD
jgi:SAM-dependent methyltransferase